MDECCLTPLFFIIVDQARFHQIASKNVYSPTYWYGILLMINLETNGNNYDFVFYNEF